MRKTSYIRIIAPLIGNTCNALEWDDDPIIPEEESKTAPVLALLENLREIQSKH